MFMESDLHLLEIWENFFYWSHLKFTAPKNCPDRESKILAWVRNWRGL